MENIEKIKKLEQEVIALKKTIETEKKQVLEKIQRNLVCCQASIEDSDRSFVFVYDPTKNYWGSKYYYYSPSLGDYRSRWENQNGEEIESPEYYSEATSIEAASREILADMLER